MVKFDTSVKGGTIVTAADIFRADIGILGGLQQGVFDVFPSDHCPYRYEDEAGKLAPKGRRSFRYVPNGIPGIATRLPILFSEGVVKGLIDLNRFVALTSTNQAKRYGLCPANGTIAVGSDADLVLWDAEREATMTHKLLQDGCDYTPHEGLTVTGCRRRRYWVERFWSKMAR